MPTLHTTLTFFGLALLLGYAPGPDILFVLMQAATHGRWAGIWVVLGLCTGLVVHTTAVALGVAALVAASPTAYTVLSWLGAAYLAYLAWQALRAPAADASGTSAETGGWRHMYLRGIVLNLTNPKVILFFLAFLPPFVKPDRGPVVAQIACLGALFIAATLVSFGSVVWAAAAIGRLFQRSPTAQRTLNTVAALIFLALAAHLVLAGK